MFSNHYPVNGDRLVIGKYCSIACGAKFLLNSANHTLRSLSTYPFPIFYEAWGTPGFRGLVGLGQPGGHRDRERRLDRL